MHRYLLIACLVAGALAADSPDSRVNAATVKVTLGVHPRTASLRAGSPQQFTATVNGVITTNVIWSVDGIAGGSALVGRIGPSGLYWAPPRVGTHHVSARLKTTGIAGTAAIFVSKYAGMLTFHNDNARSGHNLSEVALSPATVSPATFGKLFSYSLDGFVYAQPLYVPNVAIPNHGTHNVIYVATEHDSVYALDADAPLKPLWHASFIAAGLGITTVPWQDVGTDDIVPEIGISGTPVIDPASGTLYVVAETKEQGNYVHRLHAMDMTTGLNQPGSPVVINPKAPGTGKPNDGHGNVVFDPLRQNQFPALLLCNGVVYVAYASNGNSGFYHGWLLAFDARTLKPVAVYNDTANGNEGGIWESGGGPACDASGSVFMETGNGTFDGDSGGANFGDSALKLQLSTSGFAVADWFTPFDAESLATRDEDFGTAAAVLLPDQAIGPRHLMVVSSTPGNIYLIDRDQMGHFQAGSNSQIVQYLPGAVGHVYGTPAFFNSTLYFATTDDNLKAFQLQAGKILTTPTSKSGTSYVFPTGTPTVSANGNTGGIVWALDNAAYAAPGPAVLHAYKATDLSRELYNSNQFGTRDHPGDAVKFSVPTVADGRVYVGGQFQLTVFGLFP
jgi:hypothetical protein